MAPLIVAPGRRTRHNGAIRTIPFSAEYIRKNGDFGAFMNDEEFMDCIESAKVVLLIEALLDNFDNENIVNELRYQFVVREGQWELIAAEIAHAAEDAHQQSIKQKFNQQCPPGHLLNPNTPSSSFLNGCAVTVCLILQNGTFGAEFARHVKETKRSRDCHMAFARVLVNIFDELRKPEGYFFDRFPRAAEILGRVLPPHQTIEDTGTEYDEPKQAQPRPGRSRKVVEDDDDDDVFPQVEDMGDDIQVATRNGFILPRNTLALTKHTSLGPHRPRAIENAPPPAPTIAKSDAKRPAAHAGASVPATGFHVPRTIENAAPLAPTTTNSNAKRPDLPAPPTVPATGIPNHRANENAAAFQRAKADYVNSEAKFLDAQSEYVVYARRWIAEQTSKIERLEGGGGEGMEG